MKRTGKQPDPGRRVTEIGPRAGKTEGKRPFTKPKLTFVAPKLVKHGGLADVTAGFFGEFSP